MLISFAMDCLWAGFAISLFIFGFREMWKLNKVITLSELIYISATIGGAIFLTTRFIMNLIIMWSMWE